MDHSLIPLTGKRKPADLFVIGFFQEGKLSRHAETLEPEFTKGLKAAIERGRFTGKYQEVFSSSNQDCREAPEVVALGLGKEKNYRKLCLRKACGKIVEIAKAAKAKKVRVLLDSFAGSNVNLPEAAAIFSEMAILAQYDFDRYKSKKNQEKESKKISFESLVFQKSALNQAQKLAEKGRIVAEAIVTARDLINEPGNVMNPPRLAKEARELAQKKDIHCQILGEPILKSLKMGGILAVNQGSKSPAALIILEYGKNYRSRGTLCLVGKGVTFDTGGISIKPAKDMEKMKYDMSGAAVVIATLGLIADLKLPIHVVGLAPTVENMVAKDPQRPGDIIRMHNGKTVEVLNTDAEGRLILADALAYSERYHPKLIVDIATLTGACVMTFGDKAIALLGNDEKMLARVKQAGNKVGEKCWELPLWEEYAEPIKGHHSDLYNIGGPYAGTITAAMFLKEFVPEKASWIHLDIAGTAWCNTPRYDCPRGATGVGVKLLAEFLSEWGKSKA